MLPYIYEHIIMDHYGLTIDEVRDMDHYDIRVHVRLCLAHEQADREFQIRSTTPRKPVAPPGMEKEVVYQRYNPQTGEFQQ